MPWVFYLFHFIFVWSEVSQHPTRPPAYLEYRPNNSSPRPFLSSTATCAAPLLCEQ